MQPPETVRLDKWLWFVRVIKTRTQAAGLVTDGKVRVNRSGCFDRCGEGPLLVVYPEAVWYTYIDQEDIDEIIASHLVKGEVVERLRV